MRLLILSDLHLEIWGARTPVEGPPSPPPDAVILAGDIHTGIRAIEWARRTFDGIPVLYVHGNHEGHGANLDSVQQRLVDTCARGHVHFLNASERIVGGVRFLGATLWTDFKLYGEAMRPSALLSAQGLMNDYRRVRLASESYRKLRASDTAKWHQEHRRWLAERLSTPFDGRTVVVTHMAPSMRSISDEFKDDLLSAAFASELDELASKADLWVHGHTHTSFDYHIGSCRVVCNPCGYPGRDLLPENPSFDPGFVLELT